HRCRRPQVVSQGRAGEAASRRSRRRPPGSLPFLFARNRSQLRDLAAPAIADEIHDRKPRAEAAPVMPFAVGVVADHRDPMLLLLFARELYPSSVEHQRLEQGHHQCRELRPKLPPSLLHITASRVTIETNHRRRSWPPLSLPAFDSSSAPPNPLLSSANR
ncbi:hypothetical protein V8G54_014306, partial [Vigna mungo]